MYDGEEVVGFLCLILATGFALCGANMSRTMAKIFALLWLPKEWR